MVLMMKLGCTVVESPARPEVMLVAVAVKEFMATQRGAS
jgi:hypothetical protein